MRFDPLAAVLAVFLLVPPAAAQSDLSAIRGSVSDGQGSPVHNAEIVALDVQNGVTYPTLSNADGLFWIGGLRAGFFDVTIRTVGFAESVTRGVEVGVGATREITVTLESTAVDLPGLRVEVSSVETTEADLTHRIDPRRAQSLPEESRSFLELALLAPGASSGAPTPEPVPGLSIGGLNQYSTGVALDGVSLVGPGLNDFVGAVPLLAIQEFEVQRGGYATSYGPVAGLVNAVSRRGTNRVESEAFVLGRDAALNSRGVFEATKPEFRQLHLGASVSGPIAPDRAHYFVAVERKQSDIFADVVTNGAFPAAEGTFKTPLTDYLLFARVDQRVGEDRDLTFRYAGRVENSVVGVGPDVFCGFFSTNGVGTSAFASDNRLRMHSILASHRWRASERLQHTARLHYLDNYTHRTAQSPGSAQAYPSACSGAALAGSQSNSSRLELSNSLTVDLGRHRFEAGLSVARADIDTRSDFFDNGLFVYNDDADLQPAYALVGVSGLLAQEATVQLGLYVEDRWSIGDDVVLTAGLRYDVESNGTNQGFVSDWAGQLPFVPTAPRSSDLDNVSPRLGITWTPTESRDLVLRGGVGLYHSLAHLWFSGLETNPNERAFIPSPGTNQLAGLTVDPDTLAVPTRNVLTDDWESPRTVQGSVGAEWALGPGWAVSADLSAARGSNLPIQRQVNGVGGARPYPQFSNIWLLGSGGLSRSRMLTVGLRQQSEASFLDVHYTLADHRSTNDLWFGSIPITDPAITDFESELGPAGWSERHRLVLLGGLDGPLGLQFGAKAVYSSARPFDVYSGVDANGDEEFNDRPTGTGRNAGEGPDFASLDLSVSRTFDLSGRVVEARINVFNVTNRTNFDPGSVVRDMTESNFGQALAAFPKRQIEIGLRARLGR